MCPLLSEERRALLELARRSLHFAVENHRALDVAIPEGFMNQTCGAFVTLWRRGRLRGCVGRVETPGPLAEVVAKCAAAAALDDPRFEPVPANEISELEIEISVLSPLLPASLEQIEPGTHGLVVTRGSRRGILLPQVALEHSWAREKFLEEACVKAGLERDAWRDPATRIEAFTAEVFSEFGLGQRKRAG